MVAERRGTGAQGKKTVAEITLSPYLLISPSSSWLLTTDSCTDAINRVSTTTDKHNRGYVAHLYKDSYYIWGNK